MLLKNVYDPITALTDNWLDEINVWTIIIRILLAFAIAGIFGFERSNKRHTAGLRTFILVAVSSSIAAILDSYFAINGMESFPVISVGAIIGVAIISSNSLFYSSKNQIKGLTTAIALWSTSFVGLTSGAGLYTVSIVAFVVILFSLNALPQLERYLKNRSNHFEIHLELKNKTDLVQFTSIIRKLGLVIDDIEINPAYSNSGLYVYTISLSIYSKELKKYKTHNEIIEALETLDYVNCVEEIQ